MHTTHTCIVQDTFLRCSAVPIPFTISLSASSLDLGLNRDCVWTCKRARVNSREFYPVGSGSRLNRKHNMSRRTRVMKPLEKCTISKQQITHSNLTLQNSMSFLFNPCRASNSSSTLFRHEEAVECIAGAWGGSCSLKEGDPN
jgi:hypothetical protein